MPSTSGYSSMEKSYRTPFFYVPPEKPIKHHHLIFKILIFALIVGGIVVVIIIVAKSVTHKVEGKVRSLSGSVNNNCGS